MLDTLENKNSNSKFVCRHVFSELTALCPVTRLPDFYTIRLTYEPDLKLVELKSLKLYFNIFRDLEILHEELTNRILDDFIEYVRPRWARLETIVNVRGGIRTTIVRHWSRDRGDELIDLRTLEREARAS